MSLFEQGQTQELRCSTLSYPNMPAWLQWVHPGSGPAPAPSPSERRMHDLRAGQCLRPERCGIMQARAKELRAELLNSKRLEAHFEAHPGIHLLYHSLSLSGCGVLDGGACMAAPSSRVTPR